MSVRLNPCSSCMTLWLKRCVRRIVARYLRCLEPTLIWQQGCRSLRYRRQSSRGAGLDRLTPEEFKQLTELNAAYTEKFQFPFILAVRGKNKDDIINAIRDRVDRSLQEEWDQALQEIGKITRFRLEDLLAEA